MGEKGRKKTQQQQQKTTPLSKESKANPKYFGEYVQSKTKSNMGIGPLRRDDGFMAVSEAQKADVLNNFFASVFTHENTDNMPHIEMGERSNNISLADVRVTPKAVQDKLNKLNPNKAQGPDQVPPPRY